MAAYFASEATIGSFPPDLSVLTARNLKHVRVMALNFDANLHEIWMGMFTLRFARDGSYASLSFIVIRQLVLYIPFPISQACYFAILLVSAVCGLSSDYEVF